MNEGFRDGVPNQREAYPASETRQDSSWPSPPEDLLQDPDHVSFPECGPLRKRKREGYQQLRCYLPPDISRKNLAIPPALRSSFHAARLRAMDWGMNLDPERLQESIEGMRLGCASIIQALQSIPNPDAAQQAALKLAKRVAWVFHQ